ncbi:MAG: VWA domain-containing protein [Candidatus Odinarchaeota archaeon]
MTDDEFLITDQDFSEDDEGEGDTAGREYDLPEEKDPDAIEMVGSVLLELKEELRKKIIDWATRLVIQETSELLNAQRKLPVYKSEKPRDDQFLDVDLDGTIETLIEDPENKPEALRVFNRAESGHSALLIIDSSFSMSGTKLVMAAAAAATLMHVFDTKDIAVVHFGNRGRILKRFDDELSPEILVEQIFSLIPKGFTNIYQGLKVGIGELGNRKQAEYTAILLSDCDVNHGKNPTIIAWQLRGLHILTFPPEEGINHFIADLLVKETRGTIHHAKKVKDIPLILKKILSS